MAVPKRIVTYVPTPNETKKSTTWKNRNSNNINNRAGECDVYVPKEEGLKMLITKILTIKIRKIIKRHSCYYNNL